MKICKIHFENHSFFGNLDIDLVDQQRNPLNTVVFAGINGSGKTTVLASIYSMPYRNKVKLFGTDSYLQGFSDSENPESYLEASINDEEIEIYNQYSDYSFKKKIGGFFNTLYEMGEKYPEYSEKKRDGLRRFTKCIFLPTEIKFDKAKPSAKPFSYKYDFFNYIDDKITNSIPDFFATYIDKMIYSNQDTLPKESIKKACDEINSIFDILDLESRLIGLKTDGSRMPLFINKSGVEFEIDGLSSGEKQLFFRIMALKMVEANNSIILIDEPEISLHPAWQQKILKVYENIGENNQVIVATHSPHIIGSTAKENVKLLIKDDESKKFKVLGYDNISASMGMPTDRILKDIMGLETTRDPDIQKKINELWELIKSNKYDNNDFNMKFEFLENLIEPIDEDLVLMKLEIGKKKWEKDNAKNKGSSPN